MVKKTTKNTGGNAEQKKDNTSQEHLTAAMKDVNKILKLKEEGLENSEIASKVRVGVAYVDEVVEKGAETMEAQLREGYGMPPKDATPGTDASVNTDPIENATETKTEKAARVKKERQAAKDKAKADKEAAKAAKKAEKTSAEPKVPKEKRTRENALLKALEESNGAGLTLEAVGNRANEILSITRKSWTGTLGAMKRAGEITYNKETKLYNLP